MRATSQALCLFAVVIGTLVLVISLGAPPDHPFRQLIRSLPIIIAGGLIGLAILTKDEQHQQNDGHDT